MTIRFGTCLALVLSAGACTTTTETNRDAGPLGVGGAATSDAAAGTGGTATSDAATGLGGSATTTDAGADTNAAADGAIADSTTADSTTLDSGAQEADAAQADANSSTDATSGDATTDAATLALPTVRLAGASCSIDAPTHWTPAVYVAADCNVEVQSSLIIDPGAIIKFGPGHYLTVENTGTLQAVGTAALPILFTSLKDDGHGGDSGADGPTTPAKDDWGCHGSCGDMNIGGNGSVLSYVQNLYGNRGLWVQAGSVRITNSVFAHHNAEGLVLDSRFAVETTVLTGNAFYDNDEFPLSLGKAVSVDATNVFHDPANAATKNKKQCIELSDDIDRATSFGVTELGFYGAFQVNSALTVANGVIFKALMARQIILSQEGSIVNGANAIFTSPKDDSAGGDCTGDGATTPTTGDWTGLSIASTSDHGYPAQTANIRYAANYGAMPLH